MVLQRDIIKKIEQYVAQKPCTVQEVSKNIGKSWVTTDRYIQKIAEQEGTIACRTFRGGTRGALKIVYWNSYAPQSSQVQERLLRQIESGRTKQDFSPSEIFQYIDEKKKQAWFLPYNKYISKDNFTRYKNYLQQAEHQVLFFSGNLTFSKLDDHDARILDIIEDLAQQGISFKILTQVDIVGLNNVKNVLAINERLGKNAIEIRHCFQPLRATVIDNKIAHFKETRHIYEYVTPKDELEQDLHILYDVYDEHWVEWLQKVFWHLFRPSIEAGKRISDIKRIQYLK